ncbi:MAG: hypothetical protein V7740_09960 [Pseudomonas marincola]
MLNSGRVPWQKSLFIGLFAFVLSDAGDALSRDEGKEYKACIKLTKREPEFAFESALSWRDQGGGVPARHCAALALVGMKKYHLAAPRLEAIAEEMRKAGMEFVVPMLSQAANTWLLAENYSRANAVASAALELEPDNIDVLMDRSHILAGAKNYQEAFNDLDLVLRLDPTRFEALAYRAAAWRQLGNNERAMEDVDLALSLQPDFLDALIERGILYRLAGNIEDAKKDWMKVLELSPNTPAADTAQKNIEKLEFKN